MSIQLTMVLAAFLYVTPFAQSQVYRTFSPLRTDMQVAQAVISDSLSLVRRIPEAETTDIESESPQPESNLKSSQNPSGALYRSLAIAGWGQKNNGRRDKALLFFAAEAICIGGYLYENARYTSGDYSGPEKDAIRTDRNTWLLYWMISKVFGIMDAYVDAQFSSYDIEDITPEELALPQDISSP